MRSTALNRWFGRALVSGAVFVTSIAAAGCGSTSPASSAPSPSAPSARFLDAAKLERAIAASSLAQRGVHARVSCPSGVRQQKGLVFSCTAVVGQTSTQFVVTELDGSGHLHYAAR